MGARKTAIHCHDHGQMSKPTRLTIWMILIGTVLALLVVYFLCVPYRTMTQYINRRTGAHTYQNTYLGVFTEEGLSSSPTRGDPARFGDLTAEEIKLPVIIRHWRFPWSAWRDVESQPGAAYSKAFIELFWTLGYEQTGKRTIPPDELHAITKRRILLWNSADLDRDPQAIADQAHAENEALRALPAVPAK